MPDFANVNVTVGTNTSITVQRFTVECQVLDSTDGSLLADFTGANALVWPAVLGSLTGTQRRTIIQRVMQDLILFKAGIVS